MILAPYLQSLCDLTQSTSTRHSKTLAQMTLNRRMSHTHVTEERRDCHHPWGDHNRREPREQTRSKTGLAWARQVFRAWSPSISAKKNWTPEACWPPADTPARLYVVSAAVDGPL